MDVIVAKPPFDAEVALIDMVVPAAIHPVDEAIFDVEINLATDAAVRAGRLSNVVGGEHGGFRVIVGAVGRWRLAVG